MATIENAQAGAISFAHLAGITRPILAARADSQDEDSSDDKKDAKAQGDDESDEDYAKRMEDESPDESDNDKKDAKKAADDTDEDKVEDDSPDDTDEDKKDAKGKRAARSGKSAFARGVAQERARWAAVLGSRSFARNPTIGAKMLATTPMAAADVIAALRDLPPASSASVDTRAARNPSLGAGPAPQSGQAAIDARWAAAMKRAGIVK